ncbi:MAG: amino acid adenylation domain-containing protein [Candidatus Omnitrophota bacterium]
MLAQKFEEQVKKTPDRLAVKVRKTSMSYRELNQYANRIAGLIGSVCPIQREPLHIGLLLENELDMIAAIFGTLKSGNVYVPLSTDYPYNRLAYMLADSESSLIIADSKNLGTAEKLAEANNIRLLHIDGCDQARLSPDGDQNPAREINGEKLAYILYTSGSTGNPKGVMQTHQNVLYFIENWTRIFSITDADRITLLASFGHDGSIPDIYGALLNGATLYPYNIRRRNSDSNLSQLLIQEQITVWHSVPSLYNFFVSTLTGKERFPDIRSIVLGGEALRHHEIDMFKKYFSGSTLANIYGQTESTVNSIWTIRAEDPIGHLLIGNPLDRTRIFVVDKDGDEVDAFETGEILIACPHISPGYWKNGELTKKVFTRDSEYGSMYWTGDMGRLLPDGNIEFIGRKDLQVKIRGFRVELGEIETTLIKMDGIHEAVVVAKETEKQTEREREKGNYYLCAFFESDRDYHVRELRNFLAGDLPDYMIPSFFVKLENMPLTQTGKIDRKALAMMRNDPLKSTARHVDPRTDIEKIIANVWKEVLNLEEIGIHDNLFEMGGNSFDIIKINGILSQLLKKNIPIVKSFEYPTIGDLARYLSQHPESKTIPNHSGSKKHPIQGGISLDIAVIGMAGRFPGAKNIDQFWENLKNGVESISFFTDEELIGAGLPSETVQAPNYVKAKGVLEDIEYFDAAFFNFNPAESVVMDPQLRVLLECGWETFEHAGYHPSENEGVIGVYLGNGFNIGWLARVFSQIGDNAGQFQKGLLNNHLSTYVSYKFDLIGPSITLRTACSTSLVAIHEACKGLLLRECHMALAGGVSILIPKKKGYVYQEGMIYSADGHVRAFDARSNGTVFGDGVGCVLLKRAEDALLDGDTIYAVIKGSATNNDGIRKVGYTAPSVTGQREVIRAAQIAAGFEPESMGFIETHGTGTILGDAIEIEALNQVFAGSKKNCCAIGSVKTNVGHLNTAAGIAGFIKTVLCLKYKLIPPSLNFETPNPEIDFENSPFYVNTKLSEWPTNRHRLRAGVSSFGFGGTNAHLILEEAPEPLPLVEDGRKYQMLLLSARTASALDQMTGNLTDYLKTHPGINLADTAYTLQVGRRLFHHRRMVVCSGSEEAGALLASREPRKVFSFFTKAEKSDIVFMFPGQGSQYVAMGLALYETEPEFRDEVDRCLEILNPIMGFELKDILYPASSETIPTASDRIHQTGVTQPVLFIIEYSLAKLLMKWGIQPYAMIGHSIGEYTAACLSGVMSLEDALSLIACRGQLIQGLPGGSMLSVGLTEKEILPLLNDELALAAVNATSRCVVSGPPEAIDTFSNVLKSKGHDTRLLYTSHAFHSPMMEPILTEFEEKANKISFHKPEIPFISNLTGQWITDENATDPHYWVTHIRNTVRFSEGLSVLLNTPASIFIEIGPGRTLSTFVNQHHDKKDTHFVTNLMRHPNETIPDHHYLLSKMGQCWLRGMAIDWDGFYGNEKRRRIALPTYPFERQYYWIETKKNAPRSAPSVSIPVDKPETEAPVQGKGQYPRPELSAPYVAPETEIEGQLATIWQTLFGFSRVGVYDDFFELGGDSLKAMNVTSRIRKELHVQVPLAEIFKSSTIRALSDYIQGAAQEKDTSIEPVEEKEYYELSSSQKRLYILQQLDMENTAYNIPVLIPLLEDVDIKTLEDTFKKLLKRHESLRTSFQTVNNLLIQRVHDDAEIEINYFQTDFQNSFIRPFDLSKAPLIRLGLFEIEKNRRLLVVDLHHIITDGTSQGILTQDFRGLYKGEELLPLRIQYKDFSEWQNKNKEKLSRQEVYWLNEFEGEIPALNIPTDYPRPPVQRFEGNRTNIELTHEDVELLMKYALREEVTVYMIMLAVINVLLSKLTGSEDIVIGTPVAGRRHADLEKIIGMFVNTLALRNFPIGEKHFRVFLNEVKDRTLEAFENQEYPFEDLVEQVVINRDMSHNPLFDVMFTFQNQNRLEVDGFKNTRMDKSKIPSAKAYDNIHPVSKFDLEITVLEKGEKWNIIFGYCTTLFKEETIKRFMNYFYRVLGEIIKGTPIKIDEIDMLSEEEKSLILYDFNNTSMGYPKSKSLHQLFKDEAARMPDTVIAVNGEEPVVQVTYRELDHRSRCIASLLRKNNITEGSVVGIMIGPSLEMVIGIMGILQTGNAFLPIDPESPTERINYILNDSNMPILLAQSHLKDSVETQVEIIPIDDPTLYRGECESVEISCLPDDPVYVIYTSGTTGRPKGVLIRNQNLVNYVHWFIQSIHLNIADRAILTSSFAFDLLYTQFFSSLLFGCPLHVIPRETYLIPHRLLNYLRDHRITYIKVTPSLFNLIVNNTEFSSRALTRLRLVILGGEEININDVEKALQPCPHLQIMDEYGPTETAIGSVARFLDLENIEDYKNAPTIGKPIGNVRIYILDKDFHLVPVGVIGGLFIGGDGVGMGYLNKPQLTSDKFITGLWERNTAVYSTGDLARWCGDGNIVFLGRADDQVKIRGYRIELGEIESHLLKCNGVKEAIITVRENKNGEKYLCAYFVSETPIEPSVLRKYLSRHLPATMVPSYFIRLESMPLTRNNKINRGALPEPELNREEDFVGPQDEIEKTLAQIWGEVLSQPKEKIGVDDNFFELGGHSLKATVVVSRIHKELNIPVPLAEIFKRSTIRGLAECIKKMAQEKYISIEPAEKKEYYPLSPAQKRLYFVHLMAPHSVAYNIPACWLLNGALDKKAFVEALGKLIARHESLRTSFEMLEDGPIQRVHDAIHCEIDDYGARNTEELNRFRSDFIRPFDFSQAPLLRVGLIEEEETKHLLMIDMHHIITDGISRDILSQDLKALLSGTELPPLRLQYKDFSEWQYRVSELGKIKTQEDYWLGRFKDGIPILNLPTDFPRPEVFNSDEGGIYFFSMDKELTSRFNRMLLKTTVTMYMFLLAVFNVLLMKYTGKEDIVLGSPISGRRHHDLEKIIGMFVNMLSMRNRPEPDKTFLDFLGEVKENAINALDNQDFQFDELVSKLDLRGMSDRNPLFSVVLADTNLQREATHKSGPKLEIYRSSKVTSKFDLRLAAFYSQNEIKMSLTYSSALFKRETIQKMANRLIEILQQVVDNPDIKLKDIPITHALVITTSDNLQDYQEEFDF